MKNVDVEERSKSKRLAYDQEEVFVKEQGFQNEFDDIDDFATHICIYEDGKALGCVRFYVENDKMRIGRLAVLKQARKNI